jgi:diguanylate cyclase (GGDEF)-like protein
MMSEGVIVSVAGAEALEAENQALRAAVAQLSARVAELEQLADTDTLTPLANRRCFLRELQRVAQQVSRYGHSAAVLFIDVDGLKTINDTHGHRVGDLALVHVAQLLRDRIRTSDTVARIGGDEFGVLLDHVDEATAREKAIALCDAVADNPLPGGLALTISVGIAPLLAEDDAEAALALDRADGDMYGVKRRQSGQRSLR